MKKGNVFLSRKKMKHVLIGKYKLWLVLVAQLYAGVIFAQWNGGAGTSANPYQIANATQLKTLQTNVNGGTNYSGQYFKLTANIDLSESEWTPIGTAAKPFKGNFDGDGKTIKGLYINQPATNDVGLFGYLSSATVSNVGVTTKANGVKGGTNVGILAGSQNGGTITNCYVMGTVSGNDVTGGLVGNQPGGTPTVAQCFAIVDVTGGTGINGSGGLIGVVRGNLSNSYAWGDVKGVGAVSGLVGTISTNGVVNTCYAAGSVISTASPKVGGLTGSITQTSSRLKNSVAVNNSVIGGNAVGRVIGYTQYSTPGIIDNNYAVDNMTVIINGMPKVIVPDINSYDGGTKSASVLKTQSFFSTTVSWSINSVNDNTKSWNIWNGVNLPYLQIQSSPVNNISIAGTVLQGTFRPDVAMDSVLIYVKTGTSFTRIGAATVNNSAHTWSYSNPALAMNGMLYVFSYESGKKWLSYPVIYTLCALPLTFDVVDGDTYTSALNLQNCITNLQNAAISDIQFSKADGMAFDDNIILSPTTYSVDGVQTIYARAKNSLGCQSGIKSFQVKQIGSLLFKEDFGSGGGCSNQPLGSSVTTYTFASGTYDYKTNGVYGICSQLDDYYYSDYWYTGAQALDHTDPGNGRSLIVNADFSPGKFYTLRISNICPGTHLYFSTWIFNLVNPNAPQTAHYTNQGSTFNDPDLRFVLTDGADGTILKEYNTGSIPKVTNAAVNWRPYGFDFITGSSSSVILTLYNNAPGGNGNDLMIDDIEVYGNIPPVMIAGPLSYCLGSPVDLTVKNIDKTPLNTDLKVNWLFSETGDMGPNAAWDTIPNLTSVHLDMPMQKSGYIRAVVGHPAAIDERLFNCCSLSEPTPITIIPNLMYWSRTTKDNDWNNSDNWVDANDIPLKAVPGKCTDVHIPGNSRYYPELDSINTKRAGYLGEPQCRDITYHFGSEVAKPHYLNYRKAYVQYNFGYYDGSNYVANWDTHSGAPMQRGQWYALAAPLKNIVSGDFSVGGFPNMWQQGFKSSLDRNSTLVGDWYVPENTLALEIGPRQNYAISVWGGELLPGVLGENDHHNLNDLKGIFQMPYFEDLSVSAKHRIHQYTVADSTSRFYYYYFDREGLPIENSAYDNFKRGSNSYRFIIEDENNKPQKNFKINVLGGTEIMIGNPFISSLDFQDFYDKNSAVIENYYRLFDKNNFVTYTLSGIDNPAGITDTIASFQGFFVKTKGSGTVTLQFPMSSSVTRLAHKSYPTPPVQDNNELFLNASNEIGNSWVTIALDNTNHQDVPQLFINSEESQGVPQLYVLNTGQKKNVIQYENGELIEVPVGIKGASGQTVQLTFPNIDKIGCKSLILVDTRLNKEINLLSQNNYSFKNDAGTGERFLLRINHAQTSSNIPSVNDETLYHVSVNQNTLEVHSSEILSKVTVFSLQGTNLYSWTEIGSENFSKMIRIPAGVYIVEAELANNEVKVQKVIVR